MTEPRSVELDRRSPGKSIRRIGMLCYAISGVIFLIPMAVIMIPGLLILWLLLGAAWLCLGRNYTRPNVGPYGRS